MSITSYIFFHVDRDKNMKNKRLPKGKHKGRCTKGARPDGTKTMGVKR